MPIYGLEKDHEVRLSEIEYFVQTGKRADGLMVTMEWIEESLQFVTRALRETLDNNASLSLALEGSTPIEVAAQRVWRLWRRIPKEGLPKAFIRHFESLKEAFDYRRKLQEKHNL